MHDATFLLTHLLPDDAYYYFQLGKQAALGHGSTFDGIHSTNGYHPLWMWINTAAFSVFKATTEQPIRFLLGLTSVLDVAIGGGIFFLIRRSGRSNVWALFGTLIYIFNPWAIAQSLNGMESTLANAFLCLSLILGLQFLSSENRQTRWLIALSVTAVCTVLSRIDYALYIAFLGLAVLIKDARKWPVRWYAAALIPGGILLSIWGAAWMFSFGTIIPQSGFAFSEVNKTLFLYKPRSLLTMLVWSFFQWFRSVELAAHTSGVGWGLWLMLSLFLGKFWLLFRKKWREIPTVPWLVIIMISAFIIYTGLQGAIRWSGREWYFTFGMILFPLCFVLVFSTLKMFQSRKGLAIGFATLLTVAMFLWTNPLLSPRFSAQQDVILAAKSLQQDLPADVRVGTFNAGILGFYAIQPVINLDGVVNTSAFHALRDHEMRDYLEHEQIAYVLDYEIAVNYRYFPFWGTTNTAFLVPKKILSENSSYHGSRLILYEVSKYAK